MGFSSVCCAKTFLPILAGAAGGEPETTEVVALFKNGDRITGHYDGYGRIEGTLTIDNIYDTMDSGEMKMVLRKFVDGVKFDDLPRNQHDPGQGYFHNLPVVVKWYAAGGFETYADYLDAYEKSFD